MWLYIFITCAGAGSLGLSSVVSFQGMGLNDSPVGLAAYILEKFGVATNSTYKYGHAFGERA